MKKLIIIYSLLLFGVTNAQTIKYGVTGSVHNGSIAGVHGISKAQFGGSIGAFADFSLVTNDIYDSAWLYFSPQLEFSTIGEKGDWNEDEKDWQKYNMSYVAVPLYIKYFLSNHGYKGDIYFFGGPKIEFLVSDKTEGDKEATFEAAAMGFDPNKFGLAQKVSSFGYGLSVGVGVQVQQKWNVFLRFDRGLSKVYPDYKAQPSYNRFLALGLSYYIGQN